MSRTRDSLGYQDYPDPWESQSQDEHVETDQRSINGHRDVTYRFGFLAFTIPKPRGEQAIKSA